jgi:hypothetical protein
MDDLAWEQLQQWLTVRVEPAVGQQHAATVPAATSGRRPERKFGRPEPRYRCCLKRSMPPRIDGIRRTAEAAPGPYGRGQRGSPVSEEGAGRRRQQGRSDEYRGFAGSYRVTVPIDEEECGCRK